MISSSKSIAWFLYHSDISRLSLKYECLIWDLSLFQQKAYKVDFPDYMETRQFIWTPNQFTGFMIEYIGLELVKSFQNYP